MYSELLPVLDIFAMKNEYVKKLVAIFNGGNDLSDKEAPTEAMDTTGGAAGGQKSLQSFLNIPAELFPYRIQVPIVLGNKCITVLYQSVTL